MAFKVNNSFAASAMKVCIYGPEGVGKTSLAACFPGAVFIDTEDSTKFYNFHRITTEDGKSRPSSWEILLQMVSAVRDGEIPHVKTLVVDSADWAEALCAEQVCAQRKWKGIEDAGYGKGYVYLEEEFGKLLNALSEVVSRGMNVVLTAHAQMRRVELPEETGAYDHWELKLEKKTAALVKEWADMVLFCNYKTIVTKGATPMEKNKAAGGKRMMYTTHTPWWDAKNRFSLPEELPLLFDSIRTLFEYPAPAEAPAPAKPEPEPIPEVLTAAPAAASAKEPEQASMFGPADPITGSEYPHIPAALADLCRGEGMRYEDVMATIEAGGWWAKGTPPENMDPGFFDYLVGKWSDFRGLYHKIKS